MEMLRKTFFESPLPIYLTLIFAEVVLAAVWYELRGWRMRLAMLVPPALAAIVFAVSALVVTDREWIIDAAKTIARETEAGRTDALRQLLDADYSGFGNDRAGCIRAAELAIRAYRVSRVRFTKLEVQVEGSEAAMYAATIVEFGDARFGSGRTGVIFEVRWIRRPAGWRIVHVLPPRYGVEVF